MMNMWSFFRNRGFTLLEVLVAVAILGSAFAVILGAVNRSLVLASDSKNLAIAEALVQTKLAEIELEGFPEPREEKGEFAEAPGFKWSLTVKPLNVPGLNTEIRVVHLVITWDEEKKDFGVTLAMSNFK
ncbi:MAG TPA: type II secretion system protein [Thermodesulfobacteriota bacterium]|nr:type II secretion system protein [Thermodesulfobacteriota bacterium]